MRLVRGNSDFGLLPLHHGWGSVRSLMLRSELGVLSALHIIIYQKWGKGSIPLIARRGKGKAAPCWSRPKRTSGWQPQGRWCAIPPATTRRHPPEVIALQTMSKMWTHGPLGGAYFLPAPRLQLLRCELLCPFGAVVPPGADDDGYLAYAHPVASNTDELRLAHRCCNDAALFPNL